MGGPGERDAVVESRGAGARVGSGAPRPRIGLRERYGLDPWREGVAAVWDALRPDPYVPRPEWGLSSLRIFQPRIALPTRLGRRPTDGRVPVYNFVNRVPRPPGAPYSVRVRDGRDWRGGRHTYDGHLGTDFACPVGTPVVAAAPGMVVRVSLEMDMGGRKVCIDHGRALLTTSNHLARVAVGEGDVVARGQVIGWSGCSGIEFLLFSPWLAPHLHFNTWCNGEVRDPFARPDEMSLWRRRNDPVPYDPTEPPRRDGWEPTPWDPAGIDAAIEACRDPRRRDRLGALAPRWRQAAALALLANYRPGLFARRPVLVAEPFPVEPRLDLPFRGAEYRGARW